MHFFVPEGLHGQPARGPFLRRAVKLCRSAATVAVFHGKIKIPAVRGALRALFWRKCIWNALRGAVLCGKAGSSGCWPGGMRRERTWSSTTVPPSWAWTSATTAASSFMRRRRNTASGMRISSCPAIPFPAPYPVPEAARPCSARRAFHRFGHHEPGRRVLFPGTQGPDGDSKPWAGYLVSTNPAIEPPGWKRTAPGGGEKSER